MTGFLEALRTVPRVDAAQWEQLSLPTRWAVAARASVLLMTFTSAALGGLLALREPGFDAVLWVLALVGLLAAHATNNLINDYVDSARGVDRDNYYRARYGTHVLENGLLSRRAMLGYIVATAAVALAAGAAVVWLRGELSVPLMLAGAFFVLFYTWPLKYLGLGEPAVLAVWGPLMTGGAYYVACGAWSWPVALLGTVYALGPTTVIFGKHIDKLPADAAKGIRTLPVILGDRQARLWVMGMIILEFLLVGALVLANEFAWTLLLVLLNVPAARKTIEVLGAPKPAERPADYPDEIWPLWFAHHAFVLNRRFSLLFLAGLLSGLLLG
ncbi:MAG TPA: prenyltransferase [Pseudomonadales bacterium]|nr:prenyltransferase [Pseudomonadales bacterium]